MLCLNSIFSLHFFADFVKSGGIINTDTYLEKNMESTIKSSITQHFGVLSEGKGGWKMELNLVSWNDREPKYDIRSWSPDHEKMSKGVTLTKDELVALKNILGEMTL